MNVGKEWRDGGKEDGRNRKISSASMPASCEVGGSKMAPAPDCVLCLQTCLRLMASVFDAVELQRVVNI